MLIFKKKILLLNVLLFCTSLSLIQTKSLPEGDDNEQEIVDEQPLIDNDEEGSGELDIKYFDEGQIDDKLDIDEAKKESEEEDNREIGVQEDEVLYAVDEEKKDVVKDTNEEHLPNSDVDKDEAEVDNIEESFVKEDEEQTSVEQEDKRKHQVDEAIKNYEERMQELLEILDDMQKSIIEIISTNGEIVKST